MTEFEKDLLFKDLCARLPYGVKVHAKYIDTNTEVEKVGVLSMVDNDAVIAFTCDDTNCYNYVAIHEVKPYLFPLSSMTAEQSKELEEIDPEFYSLICGNGDIYVSMDVRGYDWLNKNDFDYRGLIPMGLAIDATGKNIY